jgi:hypothetical protein
MHAGAWTKHEAQEVADLEHPGYEFLRKVIATIGPRNKSGNPSHKDARRHFFEISTARNLHRNFFPRIRRALSGGAGFGFKRST